MAKVKLTKNELKAQRDALQRFTRFLPTLQLKKQQLQLETRKARRELRELEEEDKQFRKNLDEWIHLIDQNHGDELKKYVKVKSLEVETRNIAGIDTPVFKELVFEDADMDFFSTPVWYDEALETIKKLAELRLKYQILEERLSALEDELRITTQRVNLFEKVKIPEARENIRTIQIYLGDQQTAAVGRAKIAKRKTQALRQ